MDLSASSSDSSILQTPDQKSKSYISDSTLYDSALDHQLSTTAYKSCNDMSSRSSSLNMHHANTEAQLDEIYHEGAINKDSTASQRHYELRDEHTRLRRQLNTLKLQIAALRIETDHLQQMEHKQEQLNCTNLCSSQNIKATLFNSARQALNDQKPVEFPNHFFTQIFSMFAYDQFFMEQCHHIDVLLNETVQKLCIKEYQAQELTFKEKVNKKLTSTRTKLKEKYNLKLAKLEETQKADLLKMKEKCYELLLQFLSESCQDKMYINSYLKELKTLYMQENDHV
ncbi:uncharacterized protein LOC117790080 isoform X2 [Drosophila innubila]|uniref:uncharacterized protein LOC117790080 isoform X2 n=1 Tax=Drosophila innubila TaxID=198719 RepID=UPI00148B9AE0|nr:uncharacterized protein LOC117790080 isoform X2 [Drosophila innubila]